MKAALSHRGTAVLDIISPCVAFNNEDTSTKSYSYGKENEIPLHGIGFVPKEEEIQIDRCSRGGQLGDQVGSQTSPPSSATPG